MSVKIGHASIDERGKINGGTAGDSTGKEVCIRNWYANKWNVLLRPKNATLAEKSAIACEKGCANSNIGYDQYQRNTLYRYAKAVNFDLSKITTKCECDCSSFMHVCAIAGGANLTYGSNGYVTSTMAKAFVNSGDYEKLTDSKYLTSDKYLKRGDILVKESGHTVMVLGNGTGVAIAENTTTTTKGGNTVTVTLTVLRKGSKGNEVKTLQRLLNALGYNLGNYGEKKDGVDGDFGARCDTAVRAFQKANGLTVDGVVGQATWTKLLK